MFGEFLLTPIIIILLVEDRLEVRLPQLPPNVLLLGLHLTLLAQVVFQQRTVELLDTSQLEA